MTEALTALPEPSARTELRKLPLSAIIIRCPTARVRLDLYYAMTLGCPYEPDTDMGVLGDKVGVAGMRRSAAATAD
jgi:hypothetical protein